MTTLKDQLRRIDGQSYGEYKRLRNRDFDFRDHALRVERVQGDPFASPSLVRLVVPHRVTRIPGWTLSTAERRVAAADFILRAWARAARGASKRMGSGKSGQLFIDRPGQEVLARTAAEFSPDGTLTLRLQAGLPAKGRRIDGRAAWELLENTLTELVDQTLRQDQIDHEALDAHVRCVEDQQALRDQLAAHGLVAFVADDAVLPRRSGVDDRPMVGDGVVAWRSPSSLGVTLEAPHAGTITGAGLPTGVTLICGGGYHGKSTLLEALARGVYDHIPGDGRERVVSRATSVKLRAEDGRRVCGVDLSAFIGELPGGRQTRHFTSDDASGSTSQAAAVIESLELGADVLLLDEDTSATNFMIRDRRMQALVSARREPITPFIDRLAELGELGASVVLVMGGSGDYLDVANTVLVMDDYTPKDATLRARDIARRMPTGRVREVPGPMPPLHDRVPKPEGFDPSKGRKDVRVRGRDTRAIEFGAETIEIDALEQLVHPSQTRTIADAIVWALTQRVIDGRRTLAAVVEAIDERLREHGPGGVCRGPEAERAMVRPFEVGAAINRLRSLVVSQRKPIAEVDEDPERDRSLSSAAPADAAPADSDAAPADAAPAASDASALNPRLDEPADG